MDRHELLIKKLEFAVRARDLEISLFWSRATYFWAFLVVLFTGYGLCCVHGMFAGQIVCLSSAFVVSMCWIMVCRAGRYWQIVWEGRVEVLEHETIGPMFSVQEGPRKGWSRARFSVSRLALAISIMVATVTAGLLVFTILLRPDRDTENVEYGAHVFAVAGLVALLVSWFFARPVKKFKSSASFLDYREHYISTPARLGTGKRRRRR